MCECRGFFRTRDLRFSKTRQTEDSLYEDARLLRGHTGIGGGVGNERSRNGSQNYDYRND